MSSQKQNAGGNVFFTAPGIRLMLVLGRLEMFWFWLYNVGVAGFGDSVGIQRGEFSTVHALELIRSGSLLVAPRLEGEIERGVDGVRMEEIEWLSSVEGMAGNIATRLLQLLVRVLLQLEALGSTRPPREEVGEFRKTLLACQLLIRFHGGELTITAGSGKEPTGKAFEEFR